MGTGNYSAISNTMKLVHWLLMGGLLHLVQRPCSDSRHVTAPYKLSFFIIIIINEEGLGGASKLGRFQNRTNGVSVQLE